MRSSSLSRRRRSAAVALATALAISGSLATGIAQAAGYERILNGTFDNGSTDPWWAGNV